MVIDECGAIGTKMAYLTETKLTFISYFFLNIDTFDPDRVNIKHIQQSEEKKE